jgi:16S rRNA (uracil1498-N3)-methyltransferase
MKLHRCFHDGPLAESAVITLSETESHHLMRVRRARVEDVIFVVNGLGVEARAVLEETPTKSASLQLVEATRIESVRGPLPALALSLTPDSDSIVASAIELGVSAFRPVISARCTVRGAEKKPKALCDRWRRLGITALKQCERLWLPEIHPPKPLSEVLSEVTSASGSAICLAERAADSRPLLEILCDPAHNPPSYFIGPEGGWDSTERVLFDQAGVAMATLGEAILRAETACLCALASSLAHRTARASR